MQKADAGEQLPKIPDEKQKLIQVEDQREGAIQTSVYLGLLNYLGGYPFLMAILIGKSRSASFSCYSLQLTQILASAEASGVKPNLAAALY